MLYKKNKYFFFWTQYQQEQFWGAKFDQICCLKSIFCPKWNVNYLLFTQYDYTYILGIQNYTFISGPVASWSPSSASSPISKMGQSEHIPEPAPLSGQL